MSAPTRLFLDYNAFDGQWKVLDENQFPYGTGHIPEDAIRSARVVTNAPIYANSDFKGLVDGVLDVTTKDSTELTAEDVIYNKDELIEALAELSGFKIYKIVDGEWTIGYTMELVE
jgi:hypothetical protein